MAGTIKHVTKRNGVYQYQRRVPQDVISLPPQLEAQFGGKTVFRKSLRTKPRPCSRPRMSTLNSIDASRQP